MRLRTAISSFESSAAEHRVPDRRLSCVNIAAAQNSWLVVYTAPGSVCASRRKSAHFRALGCLRARQTERRRRAQLASAPYTGKRTRRRQAAAIRGGGVSRGAPVRAPAAGRRLRSIAHKGPVTAARRRAVQCATGRRRAQGRGAARFGAPWGKRSAPHGPRTATRERGGSPCKCVRLPQAAARGTLERAVDQQRCHLHHDARREHHRRIRVA